MVRSRFGHWQAFSEVESPEHVRNILNRLGIVVDSETRTNYLAFCPFHENVHTPSFSVDKHTGRYICFNHACNRSGGVVSLIKSVGEMNEHEAARFLISTKVGKTPYAERKRQREEAEKMPEMPLELLERMEHDLWESPRALEYLHGRGFRDETLKHFRIGYSAEQDMVVTPMFDVDGKPLGIVGRTIEGKRFKNSQKLPRGRTLWNIHNAKRYNTVVVVEANFDGMSVHQAGFPGVVAVLGGHFSDEHADQLARYFDTIIIMTDDDDESEHVYAGCQKCINKGFDECQGHNPGRDLGETIAKEMQRRGKEVRWAVYDDSIIYPAKDATAMTDEQIKQCVNNAVSPLIYRKRD